MSNAINSVNFITGGIFANWGLQKFGLPTDPVTIMVSTTILTNIFEHISQTVKKSTYIQNMDAQMFLIKRVFGIAKYSVIVSQDSIFYQKIISYLLTNHKNSLIQDNIEHNYNIEPDITNIQFINPTIMEEYEKNKISIYLDYESKDIIIQSSSLNVYGIKKFIQSIMSKNTSSTYLNLFMPTINPNTNPNKKSRKSLNEKNDKNEIAVKWKNLKVHTNKNLANTILSTNVQNELIDDLNNFIASEEYYNSKGIPYKRGYLLFGPPGTGKTSIIKAFASTFGFDIYIINMENIQTPEDIVQIFRGFDSAHSYHIICFEDIDRCVMFNPKTDYYGRKSNPDTNPGIRTFLNELDGIVEGNKRITVFTANSTQILDSIEALCRPGRIDKKVEVGYCDFEQIGKIYSHFSKTKLFLNFNSDEQIQQQITPANVVKILLTNPFIEPDEFKLKLNLTPKSLLTEQSELDEKLTQSKKSSQKNILSQNESYKSKKLKDLIKITNSDIFEKEQSAVNELVELLSVSNNIKEIKEKVPTILWGRQTRLKQINTFMKTLKRKFNDEYEAGNKDDDDEDES